METGPASEERAADRRFGRCAAMLALLVLSTAGVFSPTGSSASIGVGAVSAPSRADIVVLQAPGAGDIGPCADGAIDAFEDDAPSCDSLDLTGPQRTERLARRSVGVAPLTGLGLTWAHLARGPPST